MKMQHIAIKLYIKTAVIVLTYIIKILKCCNLQCDCEKYNINNNIKYSNAVTKD